MNRERLEAVGTKRTKKRTQRLTDANVAALRKERKAYLVWDVPRDVGLAVLVQPTGSKAFYCYYQHAPGQPMKSIILGRVSVLTVEEARSKAREVRRGVYAHGKLLTHSTFDDLLTLWNEYCAGNLQQEWSYMLVRNKCSSWLGRPVSSITDDDVKSLLFEQKPGSMMRLRSHLGVIFKLAVVNKFITASPIPPHLRKRKVKNSGHPIELLASVISDLQVTYPPPMFEFVIEKGLKGLAKRMQPDVAVMSSSDCVCVVEIGYTTPEKFEAYRRHGVRDIRWYDKISGLCYMRGDCLWVS